MYSYCVRACNLNGYDTAVKKASRERKTNNEREKKKVSSENAINQISLSAAKETAHSLMPDGE